MRLKEKYAVIGAGCGGQAIAGYLASIGFDVTLYNRSSDRIEPVQLRGCIDLEGTINGRGKLSYIGTDISKALADRDIIMVVITADGHKEIIEKMAPYLKNNQILILNPGRTCGALEIDYRFREAGSKTNVVIAEANTLVFTVRVTTPGIANIKGIKKEVILSALRAENTASVIDKIHSPFPQFIPATSFLETSFSNIGAVFHPVITLLNMDRISAKESFDFYTEGVTRKVAYFIEQVDSEAQNVAKALGINALSVKAWLGSRYGIELSDIYTMMRSNPVYQTIKAPTTLNYRYIWEDIPTGLVPISSFGDALGVSTNIIDYLIDKGCEVLGRNFWEEGRTIEKLGLSKENLLSELERIIGAKARMRIKCRLPC